MKKLTTIVISVFLLSFIFSIHLGFADENKSCDWTCFKGDAQRTGVASSECSPDEGRLRLLWKRKIDDKGSHYEVMNTHQNTFQAFHDEQMGMCMLVLVLGFCDASNLDNVEDVWEEGFHTDGSIFSTYQQFSMIVYFCSSDDEYFTVDSKAGNEIWPFGKDEGNVGKKREIW
ncbi:MAG: hypothetical protein R2883_03910 [Caldisericia bacterium]